jgi:hypothetical protein
VTLRVRILAAFLLIATIDATNACQCRGCGCKGGPGWRHIDGGCVSHAQLSKRCGSPLTTNCSYEGATQVCPSERKIGNQRPTS